MLKRIVRYVVILCVYALVYIILVENVGWLNFLIGLAVSFIAIIFSDKYLLYDEYDKLLPIKLWGFFIYICYLMIKIMQAGVKAAILTIKGKAQLLYYNYESILPNDFSLNLLSNSITLTPGTVTVSRKENVLLIMQLAKENEKFDIDSIKEFERRIDKFAVRE